MSDSENTYGLTAEELAAAKGAGMTAQEYAEMKTVRTQGDFDALQERRKSEGRPLIGRGAS